MSYNESTLLYTWEDSLSFAFVSGKTRLSSFCYLRSLTNYNNHNIQHVLLPTTPLFYTLSILSCCCSCGSRQLLIDLVVDSISLSLSTDSYKATNQNLSLVFVDPVSLLLSPELERLQFDYLMCLCSPVICVLPSCYFYTFIKHFTWYNWTWYNLSNRDNETSYIQLPSSC